MTEPRLEAHYGHAHSNGDDGYDPAAFDALVGSSPIGELPRLLTLADLAALPPPAWLVGGVLDLDSLALLYGRRGAHKSFLAVDMLACVAGGAQWHGRTVERAPVVYVVAEGVGGLGQRFDAWYRAHPSHLQSPDIHLYPRALNLLSAANVGLFANACVDVGAKFVVIDTLARCMVGGDENSAKDAGMAIEQLDVIRRRTGACVLAVHHAGKDSTRGGRGSTAFEAAADTVLEVGSADDVVTITATKMKNHAEPHPIRLSVTPAGSSVTLSIYHPGTNDMPPGVLETLAALAAIEVAGGVPATAWRLSSGKTEPTFYRHRKDLLTLSLVESVGTEKQPRYQLSDTGTIALSENSHDSQ